MNDSADIGADAPVLSVPLVSASLLTTTMENNKINESETQTKHSHDDRVVNNDLTARGPPLKIVKSILKPSTKSQQPYGSGINSSNSTTNTVSMIQRWWKSSNPSSNGGKKQQEILSSMNACGTAVTQSTACTTIDTDSQQLQQQHQLALPVVHGLAAPLEILDSKFKFWM